MTAAMTYDKAELERCYSKTKIALMERKDSAFFASLVFSLRHEFTLAVPTACTDGTWIKTNPLFFLSMTPEERLGVLLHETLHAAFLHMWRMTSRNPQKWNRACDYVINLMLIDRGFVLPQGVLYDTQYAGMSAEEVYALLPDIQNDSFECDLLPPDPGQDPDEAQSQMDDILIRAAMQSAQRGDKPGTIPGEIQFYLDKLLNPILPWNRILSKYTTSLAKDDYSMRRPNRRFFPKHHLPSLYSEALMDIAIAADISGSVGDMDITQVLSEVYRIMRALRPKTITLLQFDTHIRQVDKVRSAHALMSLKFTGRGGTNVRPVIEWANTHKPKLLLIFSDGGFSVPAVTTPVPVIWLIFRRPQFTAPYGKVIHYKH